MSGLWGFCVSGAARFLRPLFLLAVLSVTAFVFAACGASGMGGGSEAESYPEQDIRFLVGVSPGGGYDTFARTLAPYLEKSLPGDGKIVVENLTGAGGLRSANTLYTAQPDGYTIGMVGITGLAASQVSGEADFDLNEFTWIGRLLEDPDMVFVAPDSEFQSMEDLQNAGRELKVGLTSLGAGSGIGAILVGDAYDLDWTPVTHEGGTEARLSVIRGDTDYVVINVQSAQSEIEAGDLRPILAAREVEQFPDVPVVDDDELGTALSVTYEVAAPPDLPPEIRDALAQAFTEAANDPEFLAEMEEAGFPADPVDAQETEEVVANTLQIYEEYKEVITEALSK